MDKKVIVAGHVCLDITPVFPPKKAAKISEILKPGKLLEVGKAQVNTGGAVANTGLGMKVLGGNVTLMGKLGTDEFGDMVVGIMERYGIHGGMIRSEEEHTSYTVVIAIPGIDRCFLHSPGANNRFYAKDIPEEELTDTALFHFGYPPLMQSTYEEEGEELIRIMDKAKRAGCATSLDLAAVDPSSKAGEANWKKILQKVMPYVDFFVPSIEELCYMLDPERYEQWEEKAQGMDMVECLDLETDIKPLAQMCMDLGCKVLLLKCGAPGLYIRTAGEETLLTIPERVELDTASWAELDLFEPSYVPERILSATGAGDVSIAAFLLAMLKKETPQMCMHLAAAAGASCVASYDSLSGLDTIEKLKEKIENGWEKYKR